MRTKTISAELLKLLGAKERNLLHVTLSGMVARDEYLRIAEFLGTLGGKWTTKECAFVFKENPWPAIQAAMNQGHL